VAQLPPARRVDEHLVVSGCAVELAGHGLTRTWVFFADLEPALVFGRAGRMSNVDISSYGVHPAARECRYLQGGDVVTLYVGTGGNLDRREDEAQAFGRWLAGTSLTSSHYQPPDRPSGRDAAGGRT
jgi:hypothetical protein